MSAAEDTAAPHARAWVRLATEAGARGYAGPHAALGFRRWCRRHGVYILKDGRREWVRPADVDRALDALAAPAPLPPQDKAAALVAELKKRTR
jgi:beta-phosphoglucomutase-like phosphatase (HAD superfamily)